jgi:hypothetical protein
MSISASIDIKLAAKTNSIKSHRAVIEILNNSGWKILNNNKAVYLPLGDDGDYDWRSEELDYDALMNIIEKKANNDEVVGVELVWKDTEIGGQLLIFNSTELSFNITINRKYIYTDSLLNLVDVNWYIEKLITYLSDRYAIEQFSYQQTS